MRSAGRSVHEFFRSSVSRSSTDRIFIAGRVPRSSGFDGRPTMSRGRPRWGATFSIRKVERRDDENSEETGADPESTDPVCPSVVDFATRLPRSVLPFFRSSVLPFFRSRQTRRATAKNRRLPTIFSRAYFALAGNRYSLRCDKPKEKKER